MVLDVMHLLRHVFSLLGLRYSSTRCRRGAVIPSHRESLTRSTWAIPLTGVNRALSERGDNRRPLGIFAVAALLLCKAPVYAGNSAEDELGLWSMYFFRGDLPNTQWVIQGDLQYRQWSVGSDTEQIMRRGSLGYRPGDGRVVLSGGYAFITSKSFGSGGPETDEHRIYQEALIPQTFGARFHLSHRLRSEQRWVDGQDFRTRYRYALFANVPINSDALTPGASYLALYNELFVNGERDTGRGRVKYFDRNRAYLGFGYVVNERLRIQLGVMRQDTENLDRTQLQLGFHHVF